MKTAKPRRRKWVLCMNCSAPNRGHVLGHNVFHPVSAWPRCHERGGLFKWEVSR